MASDNLRKAAVAGAFYPARRDFLIADIEACYTDSRGPGKVPQVIEDGPRKIIGLVCPHAGYQYSGPTAAKAMSLLAADGRPDAIVIIGPNHGRGHYVSAIQTQGHWETPLGMSPIASDIAQKIYQNALWLEDGAKNFSEEHSLEVELPFIQHLFGLEMPIVPVMMLDQGLMAAQQLGQALANALVSLNVVIIASTDMTHFEPAEVAAKQDSVLIERMEALDAEGLIRERDRRNITMCGYGPVAAMITAAKAMGATQGQRIDYTNSGAVSSRGEVVAYLALAVLRD